MNNLYFSIIDQLEFFGSGKISKFDEIFQRSLTFNQLKLEQSSYFRFIYFDFLVNIGVIEPLFENDILKWRYINRAIFLNLKNKAIEIPLKQSGELFQIIKASQDIFPKVKIIDEKVNNDFISNLANLSFNWSELEKSALAKIDSVEISKYVSEKFSFMTYRWEQINKFSQDDSLYRLRGAFNKTVMVYGRPGAFHRILKFDWAFLLFIRHINISSQKLFIKDDRSGRIVIPWKVKLPAIIKRMLFMIEADVSYEKNGISYLYNKNDLEKIVLMIDKRN